MARVEYLTLAQIARAFGHNRKWAYRMAARGQLGQVTRVGKSPVRRVSVSDLESIFGPISTEALRRSVMKGIEL